MLDRIVAIKNVGLFRDHHHIAGREFSDLTLIFGENGTGKTTIAAILDSLREGNPLTITRRRTLPGRDTPSCAIRADGTTYGFDGSGWDGQPANGTIEVFFSDFVTRNVYAGGEVDSDHRRSLCELVLGRRAVEDVQKLADADVDARAAQKTAKETEDQLGKMVKAPDTWQTFVTLPEDPEVDARLVAARERLAAARAADEILKRPVPEATDLPTLDRERITAVLAAVGVDIAAGVAKVVQDHIAENLDAEGEAWLEYGAGHATGDECPFCGQELEGVDLVAAIGAYFSQEYRAFVGRVRTEATAIRRSWGAQALGPMRAAVAGQIVVASQWREQCALDVVELDKALAEADRSWHGAASALEVLLSRKQQAPLDAISGADASTAFEAYEEALDHMAGVVEALGKCAVKASEYKKALAATSVTEAANEVARLENQKTRHEEHAKDLVAKHAEALKRRKDADIAKAKLKDEIEVHASRVVGKYQEGINHYLGYFGCDLRIEKVEAKFPAGRASVSYTLTVGGHEVPLARVEADPCFETALSEGDKYSLALAFFLARLKATPDLSGRVIVFDDPVNSFGGSRRRLVNAVIRDLRKRGAQVVVLTHDERLAAMLWRDSKRVKSMKAIRPLQVRRSGNGSVLDTWDAESATRSDYANDYLTLVDYLAGKVDEVRAAPCIRRYVEQRLRHVYPGPPFETGDPLGVMIAKIRESAPGDRIEGLKAELANLEAINDAALPAHHATDDVAGMPSLTPSEVRACAEKALNVLA